jgi:probable HAF family extracellular repeat protein
LVLKFPGATRTQARAINDTGVVVGTYWDSSKNIHGFVYSKGVYRTLDVAMARATGTQPFGINNKAEIVGFYEVDSVKHGFIYHEGHYTTLDFPGATRTQAFGINNLGVVVGVYSKGEKNLSFVATPALH